MRIYTSYFANQRNLKKAGIVGVSIARFNPEWYFGNRIWDVAPTPTMLSLDEVSYTKAYNTEILSRIDPHALVDRIRQLGNGKDVALLCYEAPDKFCHRHLLAHFLNERTGADIQEFYSPQQIQQLKKKQLAAVPGPPTLFD